MSCTRGGQNPKDFAPETVANLKPVLARFPILTIKCVLPISLCLKRETSGVEEFSFRTWLHLWLRFTATIAMLLSISIASDGSRFNAARWNRLSVRVAGSAIVIFSEGEPHELVYT